MSIFNKFKKEEEPIIEEEIAEEASEDLREAPLPVEEGIVELPEGKVNRVPVKYVPAPPRDLVHDPDSNEKAKGTPSFL